MRWYWSWSAFFLFASGSEEPHRLHWSLCIPRMYPYRGNDDACKHMQHACTRTHTHTPTKNDWHTSIVNASDVRLQSAMVPAFDWSCTRINQSGTQRGMCSLAIAWWPFISSLLEIKVTETEQRPTLCKPFPVSTTGRKTQEVLFSCVCVEDLLSHWLVNGATILKLHARPWCCNQMKSKCCCLTCVWIVAASLLFSYGARKQLP